MAEMEERPLGAVARRALSLLFEQQQREGEALLGEIAGELGLSLADGWTIAPDLARLVRPAPPPPESEAS